jgi:hypothetical protein
MVLLQRKKPIYRVAPKNVYTLQPYIDEYRVYTFFWATLYFSTPLNFFDRVRGDTQFHYADTGLHYRQ